MTWPILNDLSVFLEQDLTAVRDQANQALDIARGSIEAHCRQPLTFGPVVATLSGEGRGSLYLPRFPVSAVASVVADGVLVDPARYYLDGPGGVLELRHGTWRTARRNIVATFDAGYQEIPDDIRWVVLRVASRMLRNPNQVVNESYQGYSANYGNHSPRVFTDDERRTLNRYRAPVVG